MTGMNWARARHRDRHRAKQAKRREYRAAAALDNPVRKQAMQDFVAKHALTCFACKTPAQEWAKTGISRHGPWAICVPCIKDPLGTHPSG